VKDCLELKAVKMRPFAFGGMFITRQRIKAFRTTKLRAKWTNTGASITVAYKPEVTDASEKKDLLVRDSALGNLLVASLTNIGLPERQWDNRSFSRRT